MIIDSYKAINKMTDATKFLIISDNLIRYSENEAQDGSYLNAVVILSQIEKDVNRKVRQGIISGEQAAVMLDKIDSKKNEYIKEAKGASPRKFIYDSTDSE